MHNLTSKPARIAAATATALLALVLAFFGPSVLYNINPCLMSKSCITPHQLDALFQMGTNATKGNIANTLAIVQEIQEMVPAHPRGPPKRYSLEHPWVSSPEALTPSKSIDCTCCHCFGGACAKTLPYLSCMACCGLSLVNNTQTFEQLDAAAGEAV